MHNPRILQLLAQAGAEDLRRAGTARCRAAGPPLPARTQPLDALTLRFCYPDDAQALARLAALDSSEPPRRPVLLAEVDSRLAAALSLADGTAIADPFRPSEAVVALLRARARQLQEGGPGARSARVRTWLRLGLPGLALSRRSAPPRAR